jgi:8-amino-7-oxononanoate synthase
MFSEKLEWLGQNSLLRVIKDRGTAIRPGRILLNGIEYINFSSNDYLGLAFNASGIKSAKNAMDRYGFGTGASRLLCGGTELHNELENAVADFKETEAALVFNSGYTANLSVISAIADEGDVIFSDELNHASIVDGCRLSRAKKVIYRHIDIEHLSELMKKENGKRKIVITDTVFSMDGDIAPLREIYELCLKHNAVLYIDDAHGTGVLGNGKGALAHFGIKPDSRLDSQIIQMGTFSKALGSYGAFLASDRNIIQWLINTARGFIYSTALPACIAAASIEALKILQKRPDIVERLWQNRQRLISGINGLGFETFNNETPIIPVKTGDIKTTIKVADMLEQHRIYAPAIRPPTVKIPRIRFTVTAAHTEEDIDTLIDILSRIA